MMTRGELKKEAEESLDKRLGTYAYIRKQDCYINYVDGYCDSAEPREKHIEDLEEKLANADYQLEGRDNEIRELEAQIEEMRCCENCNNFMHRIDHRCNTKCKNLSEWEIKEK